MVEPPGRSATPDVPRGGATSSRSATSRTTSSRTATARTASSGSASGATTSRTSTSRTATSGSTPRTAISGTAVSRTPPPLPRVHDFDLAALAAEAVAIEVAVQITPPHLVDSRRTVFRQRALRPGLRALGAFDHDRLVGFCVGCPSLPGTWWREVIEPHAGELWLQDCYELAELHVHPAWQRRGLGERLLRGVLDTAEPARHVLLTTPVGPSAARRLYTRLGFVEVAAEVRFPGYSLRYALLGADLPLPGPG